MHPAPFASSLSTTGLVLAAMAAVALIEAAVPFRARGRAGRAHLGPNLALTLLALAANAVLNGALALLLAGLEARRLGALHALAPPPLASAALVLLTLDLSSYVAHVAMHRVPALWRFHRVHHTDPFVDVTTAIRQHPGESLLRYGLLAAFAAALGASPEHFALYRAASALQALLEHANVRVPGRLDGLLSLLLVTPHLHKVHHSRARAETDTNYGNLFALFDRLFGTFTPSRRARAVVYGLDGFDDPALQTATGLLALPFRRLGAERAQPPERAGAAGAVAR
jgi:sterol desaturase/sphingolipid hydroxylase (fatty acid hydroxylase superfamily)